MKNQKTDVINLLADIDDRERALNRLGLTVRVRYLRPTNSKGGRYVAEICGDDEKHRALVSSQLLSRCESTRLAVAEACLAKWNKSRSGWWSKNIGSDFRPFVIHTRGHDGAAWLFFASSK